MPWRFTNAKNTYLYIYNMKTKKFEKRIIKPETENDVRLTLHVIRVLVQSIYQYS